jgi:hypothetical protein
MVVKSVILNIKLFELKINDSTPENYGSETNILLTVSAVVFIVDVG